MNSSSQQLLPAAVGQKEDGGVRLRGLRWRLPSALGWLLSSTVPCRDGGLPPP